MRINGGGSDITYRQVLRYFYTGPIQSYSSAIWSTDDNIRKFQGIIDDPSFPEESKKNTRQLVEKMKAGKGTFIDRDNYIITFDTVYKNPAHVAVVIDKGCMSSGEEFVLAAKQSKKVTLYGSNTGGVLDYANMHEIPAPCGTIRFHYATSRSKRLPDYPIDNIGIAPDVKLSYDIKDWTRYVQELMESR